MIPTPALVDGLGPDQVASVVPPLEDFHRAGVLGPSDVHGAVRLARLVGDGDPLVLLGYAFALRAARTSHVCLDLRATPGQVAASDPDLLADLTWPPLAAWRSALADAHGVIRANRRDDARTPGPEPFVLDGERLYLRRLHDAQGVLLDHVRARAADRRSFAEADRVNLLKFLPDPLHSTAYEQRQAAKQVLERGLTVIAGGPGTGKTTCIGGLLTTLDHKLLRETQQPARVALAAPTGKAAIRLHEAVQGWADGAGLTRDARSRAAAWQAVTLHRLLGMRPGGGRARHDASEPLDVDVVVVDETSMADLPLLAALLEAVPPQARVVLVGDPGQLRSVESGSVLGDLVGPLHDEPDATSRVSDIHQVVSVLRRTHRFATSSRVGELAAAVRSGDADAALDVLRRRRTATGDRSVRWVDADGGTAAGLARVRDDVLAPAVAAHAAAERGDVRAALQALLQLRVLAAHREGAWGVEELNRRIHGWLGEAVVLDGDVGTPLLVGENHRRLGLFNGDLGIVVRRADGRRQAVFPGGRETSPGRLADARLVHAMTVHKAQGSEFAEVVVVLPPAASRLASRELVYTALTRAPQVTIVGTEEMVRAAVIRRVERSSGIRPALWG